MKKLLLLVSALSLTHCQFSFVDAWIAACKTDPGHTDPKVPEDPKSPDDAKTDSLALYPTKDVHVDIEDKNTGLGSEVRLYYPDAVAFIGFDQGIDIPAGKTLVEATLTLHGWSDGAEESNVTYDIFRTGTDWTEGTGHWYWYNGGGHNGFAGAYSQFPAYVPPTGTRDPAPPDGIHWSNSQTLRAGMEKLSTAKGVFPRGYPWGSYPLIGNTGPLVFDLHGFLNAFLKQPENQGKPLSFAIRQSPPEAGPNEGMGWIYSRNHPAGPMETAAYAPRLLLRFR